MHPQDSRLQINEAKDPGAHVTSSDRDVSTFPRPPAVVLCYDNDHTVLQGVQHRAGLAGCADVCATITDLSAVHIGESMMS